MNTLCQRRQALIPVNRLRPWHDVHCFAKRTGNHAIPRRETSSEAASDFKRPRLLVPRLNSLLLPVADGLELLGEQMGNQFRTTPNREFIENITKMRLHRLLTDLKSSANFCIAQTFNTAQDD